MTSSSSSSARLASLLVMAFAPASLAAPPLPPDDPPEPPPDAFPTCDPGHLFEFPFNDGGDEPFGELRMASPAPGSAGVPRNVEIVLGGFVQDLDAPNPFVAAVLRDSLGNEVPTTRSGALIRPLAPLAPNSAYVLRRELTDPDSCPGCDFERSFPFTTGDQLDVEPPRYDGEVVAQALVFSEEDRACGFGGGFNSTHLLLVRLGGLSGDVKRISVAVKPGAGAATRALDAVVRDSPRHLFRAGTEQVALGDPVLVAVTPVDVAGNEGEPVTVRARARSFDDIREAPFEELGSRQCDIPDTVRPARVDVVPTNARFAVDMPVEPVPLALVGEGVTLPLHPVEHAPWGQVLEASSPLPAGATLALTTLPCEHCECIGCDEAAALVVEVGDGPDERPPAPPAVLELREDLDPPSSEDVCLPDRAALILQLEAGDDDETPPERLRYDVSLRLADQLPAELGRSLPAVTLGDGTMAVRVDGAPYGRLLSETFELEVTAVDLAGNRSTTTTVAHGPETAGCRATGAVSGAVPVVPLLSLLGMALLLRRRRRAAGLP